jgi:hypothetical protein
MSCDRIQPENRRISIPFPGGRFRARKQRGRTGRAVMNFSQDFGRERQLPDAQPAFTGRD